MGRSCLVECYEWYSVLVGTYSHTKTPLRTYTLYQVHTNSPAPIATRLKSDKLVDDSP